ncbi:hypothetical protein L1987_14765 [Smallanthus sonchifolius]|uniref:Uncharacterized protein n=1 Tax=Smallanthus sonchifolius TaxID=185202 RepID=A0ACB9J3K8_9ASTR|nr:hypothetical protein L1987_14765 [Smallanthus sonchifolius]
MDPRFGRIYSSGDGDENGIQFGNGSSRYQTFMYSQNFRGLQFPPLNNPPVVDVSANLEDELLEDCDLSDAILGFITQVLMEEDMDDKSCMLQESLDLQAQKDFSMKFLERSTRRPHRHLPLKVGSLL